MSDLIVPPAGMTVDEAVAAVSAVLDNLRAAAAVTPAAVDPDGYPSHVAAGELIESAWGNAVVDKLRLTADDESLRPRAFAANGGGGTTAGPAELGVVALNVPAPPVAGRLQIAADVYVVKSVPTDVFYARLKDGIAIVKESRADTGNAIVCHFVIPAQITQASAVAKTLGLYLVRAAGTGTATFAADPTLNQLSAVFIAN